MKKALLIVAALVLSITGYWLHDYRPQHAQAGWVPFTGAGAPSGTCTPFQMYVNTSTSDVWMCLSGTWTQKTLPEQIYNPNGTLITNAHIVVGGGTLTLGTATLTFSGAAAFTSASSYKCVQTDNSALNILSITILSSTQITVSGTGLLGDTFSFMCAGN